MSDDSEIHETFKDEAMEIVKQMRTSCESLRQKTDENAINDIAKCAHKMKGAAGMMGYSHIEELAREMESVSKLIMNNKPELKPEAVAVLWESVNLLAKYIETDFDERDAALLEKLRKLSSI
jgi:two-component system chemotaxis sensor kinase CheA